MINDDAFWIRVFAPSGLSRGIQTVDKDNWNGKAIICRRAAFPESQQRPEFQRPGVYILYAENDADLREQIYVGEGDPILNRLQSHYREKDFWTDLIAFTAGEDALSKAHIQYLESRLVELAAKSGRAILENGNAPNLPTLSEMEIAFSERFLKHILECMAILRLDFFTESAPVQNSQGTSTTLVFTEKDAFAQGSETDDGGILVLKDSTLAPDVAKSTPSGAVVLREELLKTGVVATNNSGALYFTRDYRFNSPSQAACVIGGASYNGRDFWKTSDDGTTLKIIQERRLNNAAQKGVIGAPEG